MFHGHHTQKTKQKISKSKMGQNNGSLNKNYCRWNGRKHTEATKLKMSLAKKGKKPNNWKGGYENDLMLNRKRRVWKLGNGGSHTLFDWQNLKAQYNWTCPCCHESEPEIVLTEDHIIPLSKGGSDNIENIQPLCKSCNCSKHTKIIKY